MKKITLFIICALFTATVFAQNVKPYVVDLNKVPASNDDKTVAFDKTTKTVTIKKQLASIYIWLNNLDISDYNIIKLKYLNNGDYGFVFELDYGNDKIDWCTRATYCPTYLTEMEIPLNKEEKKLNGISLCGPYGVPFEKSNGKFVIESITLENVPNPQKTDVFDSNEPPVIDTAENGTIDANLEAWDFVKRLGAGLNYQVFQDGPIMLDYGYDIYTEFFSKPTKEQIHFFKEKGFNTIRLQTSPGDGRMIDKSYRLSPGYIKNIKQVVNWCIEEDMYVIICGPFAEFVINSDFVKRIESGDIHWGAYYLNEKDKKESEKFLKAIWKQFAEAFNNSYDEHLIFETLNEPVDMKHDHRFQPENNCATCKKDFAILNEYNQLIVDTIRSTGGNNANRFIVVEGIGGGCKNITNKLFKLPKDKAKNKLIPTVHVYPMGANTLEPKNYYTDAMKNEIKEIFTALDKTYFSKHIPVLVGEVGHMRFSPILERINCIKDFMSEVTKSGRSCAACFFNDSDITGEKNFFCYYDSWNIKWLDTEYVDTFIYGSQGKEYPLTADFIKKNEVKVESIVGKNLLSGPVEIKQWDSSVRIDSDVFYRSTPAKYKLVVELERTDSDAKLELGYDDYKGGWHNFRNTTSLKNLKMKGGSATEGTVKADTVEISIDEKLAKEIVDCSILCFNGQNIIIKSVKVME